MKRIILMVLVIGISIPVLAQNANNLFERLTEKYAEKDGFSASMLTSDMFDLYLKKKNLDENSEVVQALKDLESIVVVSQGSFSRSAMLVRDGYVKAEDIKPDKAEKDNVLHKEILEHYKNGGYTLLKTEKKMGEDVKVYLKKNQDVVTALALVTNSSVSTNLVELQGKNIDLSNVASLNKTMNLRGLENLYKLDNSNSGWFNNVFPGGNWEAWNEDRLDELRGREYERARSRYREFSEQQVKEMTERAREMAEQAKLSDEQISRIEKQAQLQAQKQAEMAEKYRQMAEQYGRQPVFLSTPGDTNTVYIINGKKIKPEDVKETLKGEEIKEISKNKDDKKGQTVIRIKTK